MTLKEMQEQRSKLVHDARQALEEIRANTDEARTAELETRHDTIMADFDKLETDIAREERVAAAERSLAERELRGKRPPFQATETERGSEGDAITYRSAFYSYLRAQGNEALLDGEIRAVLRSGYQELSAEQRAQVTGTNTAGGYVVPTELQAMLIKTMKMWGPMYDPGVTFELATSSGASMPFPTVDDTANTSAATTQGTTLTDDGSGDVTFGQKSLSAYAYATPWLRVSKELADDSILNMESVLADLLGERLGRTANSYLTTGTGSSQPNGIVTASTLGKTAASASAITFDEIIDLTHSVDPAYRGSPKVGYMMHDSTLQALRKLKDGQNNYLWQHGNVQQGVPATINSYPYHINQAMGAIATGVKVMVFGDLGKFIVRKVGAPLIGAIQDKDFWPGFGIAGWIRFDGNLMDTAAVKHYKMA